jgi:hypothetical protein
MKLVGWLGVEQTIVWREEPVQERCWGMLSMPEQQAGRRPVASRLDERS